MTNYIFSHEMLSYLREFSWEKHTILYFTLWQFIQQNYLKIPESRHPGVQACMVQPLINLILGYY